MLNVVRAEKPAPVAANRFASKPGRGIGAGLVFGVCLLLSPAFAFDTKAPTAVMTDLATGTVLFEKNADQPTPPASLAKLMTMAVIFDQLKAGKLKLEDRFPVSERAWREGGAASGGSTMFLPLNSMVSVNDLIQGIVIQSGNDATIVAAEGIAGSVESFVDMMNAEGVKIGLTASHFTNPHGLPDPALHVTMRDLDTLASYLILQYPDNYHLFSEEEFTFNGIRQHNRNPLLGLGADGLKTGHTNEAGFGLVASATDDGRRIVLAMAGLASAKERAEEARQLMTFGLHGFEEMVLVPAEPTVGEVQVAGGAVPSVTVHPEGEVRILAARGSAAEYERSVVLDTDVKAPVAAGAKLGTIRILHAGVMVREEPLVAANAVEEASMMQRAKAAFASLF